MSAQIFAFPGTTKPAKRKNAKPAPFYFANACHSALRWHVMREMIPALNVEEQQAGTFAVEFELAILRAATGRDDDLSCAWDVLTTKEWRKVLHAIGVEPPASTRLSSVESGRYRWRQAHPTWTDKQIEARVQHMEDLRLNAVKCLAKAVREQKAKA